MGRVVVGVDGSSASREAVSFAVEEARLRGDVLEVVHVHPFPAWPPPSTGNPTAEVAAASAYGQLGEPPATLDHDAVDARAREAAEAALAEALAGLDSGGVTVERTVLFDRRPARVLVGLVNTAADVDLLVVGSRGRGELSGALLGSVSQACAAHARVPVTVVHGRAA